MHLSEPPADGPVRPPGPPRVLVVDDDRATRLLCAAILLRDGYDVLEAADGQEGLEVARQQAPDIVLLDISMPVLDGFGLAAALQADERTREVPLIFLTGEKDPLIKAKAFETGAHAVIAKPFDPNAVTTFIERVLTHVVPKRRFTIVDPSLD